jgi:hypothetical protein
LKKSLEKPPKRDLENPHGKPKNPEKLKKLQRKNNGGALGRGLYPSAPGGSLLRRTHGQSIRFALVTADAVWGGHTGFGGGRGNGPHDARSLVVGLLWCKKLVRCVKA